MQYKSIDINPFCSVLYSFIAIFCLILISLAGYGQPYDIIIRNGQVIDGSGNPWYAADIAIQGDKIAAIGQLSDATATQVIDASGLTVCPGFIDIHSHADGPLGHRRGIRADHPKLRAAHNLVMQGITTIAVNHDGRSPTSIRAQRKQLEEQGFGPNVMLMVGHNTIRAIAMDNDYKRKATAREIEKMKESIREAMDAGAFGLSAGLEYIPGRWSDTQEMIELVSVLKPYGGVYIVHERASGSDPMWYVPSQHGDRPPSTMLENILEVISVAEQTQVPSCATHIKVKGADYWGSSQAMIYQINRARDRGVPVWADQYPYNTSGSDGNTILIPDWALDRNRWTGPQSDHTNSVPQDVTYAEILENNLTRSETRALFEKDVLREIERRGGPDRIIIFDFPDKKWIGKTLAELSNKLDKDLIETVIHIQKAGFSERPGGARLRGFSMNEMDIEAFAAQEWLITASDAGVALPETGPVHARFYGTFPRKISHYALKQNLLSVEDAIRSATSLPAQFMGLKDRGLLREGMKADVTLLDLKSIKDNATFEDPHQYPTGISTVIVNGQLLVHEHKLLPVFPGEIVDVKENRRYTVKSKP